MSVLIISVMADDRPGIVEDIADCLTAHESNWLESRLANLAGKFTGIIRIEVPEKQQPALLTALNRLAEKGIRLTIDSANDVTETAAEGVTARFTVTGSDRTGIVREITGLLAQHGVNVQELASRYEQAPMSGGALFIAELTVRLPEALSTEALTDILESISDDLMVDLD